MGSLSVHLVVDDPALAADWYVRAFGAQKLGQVTLPNGQIMTVDLRVGETLVAVAGEMPEFGMRTPAHLGGTSGAFHVPVDDVDTAFARAIDAGATVFEPVHDAFWGDRTGQLLDPSGHRWALDQHVRDVAPEEIARLAGELMSGPDAS